MEEKKQCFINKQCRKAQEEKEITARLHTLLRQRETQNAGNYCSQNEPGRRTSGFVGQWRDGVRALPGRQEPHKAVPAADKELLHGRVQQRGHNRWNSRAGATASQGILSPVWCSQQCLGLEQGGSAPLLPAQCPPSFSERQLQNSPSR